MCNVGVSVVAGNVALAGTQGGPEKYDMYLRYGRPPTAAKWDWKAEVINVTVVSLMLMYLYFVTCYLSLQWCEEWWVMSSTTC